jgi:serine protease Do
MALRILFLAIAAVTQQPRSEPLEWLRLHSGHTIRGEVLKERDDALVVDIGVDVLVIPKSAVAGRSTSNESAVPTTGGRQVGESGHLFATADLPRSSIKELVDRFGEAVVLVKTPSGLGSGFIIDDAGHCITNYHVIEQETRITVDIFQKSGGAFTEKSIGDVEIVATNPHYDLALVKIPNRDGIKFHRVYFGFSEEVRQGETAFAIGNPQGLTRSVSEGIISSKSRQIRGQLFIQTTAQINPGNSGGPLFNTQGQVIGVTNMKLGSRDLFFAAEGLGFAIPISYVKDFLINRDAFIYNKDHPNSGYRYLPPPRRTVPIKAGASRSAK